MKDVCFFLVGEFIILDFICVCVVKIGVFKYMLFGVFCIFFVVVVEVKGVIYGGSCRYFYVSIFVIRFGVVILSIV